MLVNPRKIEAPWQVGQEVGSYWQVWEGAGQVSGWPGDLPRSQAAPAGPGLSPREDSFPLHRRQTAVPLLERTGAICSPILGLSWIWTLPAPALGSRPPSCFSWTLRPHSPLTSVVAYCVSGSPHALGMNA